MRRPGLVLVIALAVVAAGCAAPTSEDEDPLPPFTPPTMADYPHGEPAECPPVPTLAKDFPFNATPAATPRPGPENVLHVDPDPDAPRRPVVTWAWAHVAAGERADDLARVGSIELGDTTRGEYYVCASVHVAAATADTPPASRNATLQLRVTPGEDLPPGNYTFILNWAVGCRPCAGVPEGNVTTTFTVPDA